jgi:endoglucanase
MSLKQLALALCVCLVAATAGNSTPLALKRGVGVHEWLNWSPLLPDGSYKWPPYRSEPEWLGGSRPISDWPKGNEFQRIHAMGFDFIRLSVDPGPLVASQGEQRLQALDVLKADVERVTETGLKVVVDLHAVTQVPAFSIDMVSHGAQSDGVRHYRAMVRDVAAMLAAIGTDKVALEPYNEPVYYPCDASGTDDWQNIMAATVADIRSVSNDLTIVATGACGGSVTGLLNIDPGFDDPNIYYSFHMYDPHSFTHQRRDDPKAFYSGLPWPADQSTAETVITNLKDHMAKAGLNKLKQAVGAAKARDDINAYFAQNWGPRQLNARIEEAADWARAHDIPTSRMFMGEFGAILMSEDGRSGAFDADRLRYLTAVRQAAENLQIPWSSWEYSNPYGISLILPHGAAVADSNLLQALGLEGN